MGTNYYAHSQACYECGRSEKIRIGYQAAGWKFLFNQHESLDSFQGWKYYLALHGVTIRDEYGNKFSRRAFWEMVDNSTNDAKCQVSIGDEHSRVQVDSDGYYFDTQ